VEHHGFSVPGAGLAYMLVSLGVLPGTLAAGRRLGRLPLRPLLVGSRLAMGLLIAAAVAPPVGGPASVALMALSSVMLGIGAGATNTLLLGETPAGTATTMTLNQMANSLGGAAGAALGGLLLATRGYPALGLSALVGFAAAAALIAWSAPAARHEAAPVRS
jgi:predicted MFS family arabinose efflux permease